MFTRLAICCFALTAASFASAQEPVAEYLGETSVRAAMLLMKPNGSEAAIYFDKGYGTQPIALVATINWKLTVGENPYKYALFRIRDGGVLTDDYWATETVTWSAYQADKNIEALKAASGHFAHFKLSSDYQLPNLAMPAIWEDQSEHVATSYQPDNSLMVVRRQDDRWEWTVRGTKGVSAWTEAPTKEQAKAAAQAFFEGGGVSP